jgi:hypothetical protein
MAIGVPENKIDDVSIQSKISRLASQGINTSIQTELREMADESNPARTLMLPRVNCLTLR